MASSVYLGGGGTPGGSDTQIQFNDNGAFGGSANFTRSAVDEIGMAIANSNTGYNYRFWNTSYDSGGLKFNVVAGNGGDFSFGADGPTYVDYGAYRPVLHLTDPEFIEDSGGLGDAGINLVLFGENFSSPVIPLAATFVLSNPVAVAVTNVGTAGASTVTYKLVGKTSLGYHSGASAALTTTTSNATLTGSNFNRLAAPSPEGYYFYDIYRTAGGPSQGLIASNVEIEDFPFDDTGIAGDASTPTTVNNTGHLYASVQLDAVDISLANGKAIKTDTVTAHTALFQVYDVNGAAYRTWMTATNGDAPSVALTIPTTGTLTMVATSVKATLQTTENATTGLAAGVLAALTNATIVVTDGSGQVYRVPCVI